MEKTYTVNGMTCVICRNTVEKGLKKLDGVSDCRVNLMDNEATVTFDETKINEETMAKTLKDLGYEMIITKDTKINMNKVKLFASCALVIILMYFSMGHMLRLPLPQMSHVTSGLIQMAVCLMVFAINFHYFRSGFNSFRQLSPNMDSLVFISSSVSFLYSLFALYKMSIGDMSYHYFFETGAMIVVIVSIGKYIEGENKKKTTRTIRGLSTLRPMQANILIDGVESIIPIDELKKGDTIVIHAGESIPQDAVVISGISSVDESMITGESIPANKTIDDALIGGTININGELIAKVTKNNAQTVLSKIISLTKQATMAKIPIQRFADKICSYFVVSVLGIAALTFVIWLIASHNIESSLNFALCVLVISCPCALGLATPSAITVATGVAAKNGILIKNPEILEVGGSIKTVILDKTGTLTANKLSIVENREFDGSYIATLAALEKHSLHPIAKAVNDAYPEYEMNFDSFEEISGEGIIAKLGNDVYFAGNRKMMERFDLAFKEDDINYAKQHSYSYIGVGKNDKLLGITYLSDIIKGSSKGAIENIKKRGITPIMCTGDNEITATRVAKTLGIDEFRFEVKPADKNTLIIEKKEEGKVAMVGDGVNDAIALSSADISISVANGSDIAYASSDVILMANDINDVAFLIDLSRKTMNIIKQNMFWALFYNALFIPLAAGAFYKAFGWRLDPMIGAFTMSISSIFVLSNALRINNIKKEKIKTMNKTVVIEGMMCKNCKRHVEEALEALGAEFTVSLEEGKAYIKNTTLEDSVISDAIEEAGYDVVEITND